eukprot:6297409-Pyramimonas_sp.AAC.1
MRREISAGTASAGEAAWGPSRSPSRAAFARGSNVAAAAAAAAELSVGCCSWRSPATMSAR